MKVHILPAVRLTLVCLIFFSGFYTLAVLGIAQLSSNKGNGETITQDGKIYYANIGQSFNTDSYFWSRPSAVGYNAAGSAGSNKGPSNPAYLEEVQARIDTFLVHHSGVDPSEVPSELVTASGSGLDPNISVKAALIQVNRIATTRNLTETTIHQIIVKYTEPPLLGLFGTEKVNVLRLNLALDQLKNINQ